MKSILYHLNSKCHLIPFVPWYHHAQTPVLYMSSLLLVLSPTACSHGLFLDLLVGVLRPVQVSPLPCTEMEHGSSLGDELSMI